MKLSEFKDALESDARKICKEQEKEIVKLRIRVHKLQHEKACLFNRCRVLTRGMMCIWCGMREDCENTRTVDEKESESK